MKYPMMVFVLALVSLPAFASTHVSIKTGDTHVRFDAVGRPSSLHIRGTTDHAEGAVDLTAGGVKGEIAVDLATLTTGIEMRDHHMIHRYLEADQYPKAVLHLLGVEGIKEGAVAPGKHGFDGEFELHGVKKPVKGTLEITDTAGTSVSFKMGFDLDMSDFKIATPEFMGIRVANKVDVEIDGKVVLSKGAQ